MRVSRMNPLSSISDRGGTFAIEKWYMGLSYESSGSCCNQNFLSISQAALLLTVHTRKGDSDDLV